MKNRQMGKHATMQPRYTEIVAKKHKKKDIYKQTDTKRTRKKGERREWEIVLLREEDDNKQ